MGNWGTGEGGGNGQATAQQVSGCDELSVDLSDAVRRRWLRGACSPLSSGVGSS